MLPLARCIARAGASCSTLQVQGSKILYLERSVTSLPSLKIYSIRRRFAEKFGNTFDPKRQSEIGPDLACLEWLVECGATQVKMSDGTSIGSISEMRKYLDNVLNGDTVPSSVPQGRLHSGDLAYEKKWPGVRRVHIVSVDASDSAIANPGFPFFKDLRRLEKLKLNFCDYFGDEGLRELAGGTPASTLKDLEIVLNPCVTDGSVYWLSRLKGLRRAHFYFLPYVANRQSFIRQLKTALPKCNVTFPEVENVGYGYDDSKK